MSVATVPVPGLAAAGTVRQRLRAAGLRLRLQSFLAAYGVLLLWSATAALIAGVFCFVGDAPVWNVYILNGLIWLPLVGAGWISLHGLSEDEVALRLDRLAATRDRCHTALRLLERPPEARTPVENLALEECSRFVAGRDFRSVIPLRLSRETWFAPIPLIALAMLAAYIGLGIGQPPHDAALDAAVDRRADVLEKMAERLKQQNATDDPHALDKLADELKKSAERLKNSERVDDQERLKTALKEISSLQAMLDQLKRAAQESKYSPAELDALAKALAANERTQSAAESLRQGNLEQAAAQLEQMLEQLKKQGNAAQALQQLAQSMQEQAAKLTAQERNEIARQMEQAAQGAQSGQPQLSQQSLQRLAELLRQMGQNGQGKSQQQQQQRTAKNASGKGGQPMTEKQLQDLINALENMKEGLQPGDQSNGDSPGQPEDGQGNGSALSLVESFAQHGSKDPNAGLQPSGHPGTEHDEGHPDKIFGDKPEPAARQGQAHRVEGTLGDGESLQQLTAAGAGGPARAGRRYRELYEALAPAAQQTVQQEDIPLGSRFYIQRYFESIRPKE